MVRHKLFNLFCFLSLHLKVLIYENINAQNSNIFVNNDDVNMKYGNQIRGVNCLNQIEIWDKCMVKSRYKKMYKQFCE